MNLGNVLRFTIRFSPPEEAVKASLDGLRHRIEEKVIPWMSWLTPARALAQIREFGEDAYCERIWLEDYQAKVGGST
jgi:hypothetical protein